MTDVILETKQLTKEFKGFTAVSEVNLSVQRGHIHALIGPNGAGKTTCFNLLTKFLVPTSGQGCRVARCVRPVVDEFAPGGDRRSPGTRTALVPRLSLP